MQPRRLARELALLTLGQISADADLKGLADFDQILAGAVTSLTQEAQETLETAITELQQGDKRLADSEIRTNNLPSARAMVQEAIDLTEKAINRLSIALDLPQLLQMANQAEVRDYALEISQQVKQNRPKLDEVLNESMTDWTLDRLPHIDQDILRMALAEMTLLGVPHPVAISEAVELAKRYSDDEGRRLINGVLRRVLKAIGIE
ncbi:MAG: transcription antitermination factor NusB [Prochlorotrichaceae cyanobacterium]|jgi:N utilization substance protein B